MNDTGATAAVNRFGLGAKPGELALARDPRDWLRAQLRTGPDRAPFAGLPDSGELLRRQNQYRQERRQAKPKGPAAEGATPQVPAERPRTALQQALRRDAWRRIVDFMRSTMSHTGAIVVRFGAPLAVVLYLSRFG